MNRTELEIKAPALDVTRAPRRNLSVDLDPAGAARRREIALNPSALPGSA